MKWKTMLVLLVLTAAIFAGMGQERARGEETDADAKTDVHYHYYYYFGRPLIPMPNVGVGLNVLGILNVQGGIVWGAAPTYWVPAYPYYSGYHRYYGWSYGGYHSYGHYERHVHRERHSWQHFYPRPHAPRVAPCPPRPHSSHSSSHH